MEIGIIEHIGTIEKVIVGMVGVAEMGLPGKQGPPGIGTPGEDGEPGQPGPIGLVWTGNYDNDRVYVTLEAVYYENNSYICILTCVGILPTEANYWSILVTGNWDSIDLGSFK
jgi:hypothetical protein